MGFAFSTAGTNGFRCHKGSRESPSHLKRDRLADTQYSVENRMNTENKIE